MEKGLESLEIYQDAMEFADSVWDMVGDWEHLAQRTVGEQWIRSSDSVAANLAEGYGRYHFKENLRFCCYARGSLQESIAWLKKAVRRRLVPNDRGGALEGSLLVLLKRLNAYIGSISRAATD